MQETSLPTTKAAQCPKCGKYHALIAIEMCNKYRKAERKFYSDAMARGFEVVDTTTKDAKDNFAESLSPHLNASLSENLNTYLIRSKNFVK